MDTKESAFAEIRRLVNEQLKALQQPLSAEEVIRYRVSANHIRERMEQILSNVTRCPHEAPRHLFQPSLEKRDSREVARHAPQGPRFQVLGKFPYTKDA